MQETVLGGQVIYSSVISATRTARTLMSPGIPILPRPTLERGMEICVLNYPFCRFS